MYEGLYNVRYIFLKKTSSLIRKCLILCEIKL